MTNTRTRVVAWIGTLPGCFRATSEAEVWSAATEAFKTWARLEECPNDFGIALASCGYAPVHIGTNRDKYGNIVSETWQLGLPA